MNVAIIGFDTEGKASYEFFKNRGDIITICDKNETTSIPEGTTSQLGDRYLDNLDTFDVLVRTPGLHPHKILEKNPDVAEKITSATNEFFKACPTKNIIGVTGTKGKGTTSTLITKILEAAGKRVHLAGNIGIPMLSILPDIRSDDWVVLELSNFQLIDLRYSPHIAACVMVVPEHQDWHTSMDEYVSTKSRLFLEQTSDDIAIFYAKNDLSQQIASAGNGVKIPYFVSPGASIKNGNITIDGHIICQTSKLRLPGEHNWQNACAAVTVTWQITQDIAAMKQALESFEGLPFRIEFREKKNGLRFYNDSFATGPGATLAAIQSITGQKVMIIGGHDRGLDLDELADALTDKQNNVHHVLLIGDSAQRVADALKSRDVNNYTVSRSTDMQHFVQEAVDIAEEDDAIVLSPAFASFGLFKNFEDRGRKFNEAVERLT